MLRGGNRLTYLNPLGISGVDGELRTHPEANHVAVVVGQFLDEIHEVCKIINALKIFRIEHIFLPNIVNSLFGFQIVTKLFET